MLNETFILKLLNLVEKGMITPEQIKNTEYRTEVESRLGVVDESQ